MLRLANIVLLWLLLAVVSQPSHAQHDKRVALVIGNSAYKNTPLLANPVNDSGDITAALKRLGFDVISERNLTKVGMDNAFRRFARAMDGADAAVFFYAGHGMQYQGANYLMPVDAKLEHEADLPYEMAQLDNVLADMARVNGTRIAILDACRNNPLERKLKLRLATTRGIAPTRGFNRVKRSEGLLVAFATQTGEVAEDGVGKNSPFHKALLTHIETPGLEVGPLFRRVASAVNGATGGQQTPEISMSLLGEFYFAGRETPAPVRGACPRRRRRQLLAAWKALKGSNDAAAFEAFANRYPDSIFSDWARLKLKDIRKAETETAEGSGDFVWKLQPTRTVTLTDTKESFLNDVAKLSDGDFVLISSSGWVVRLAPDGTRKWETRLPDGKSMWSVSATRDGGLCSLAARSNRRIPLIIAGG